MKKLLNLKTLQIAAAFLILIVVVIIMVLVKARMPKEEEVEIYTYSNVAEQVLADEVFVYLKNAAGLGDAICSKTGNEAVETYRNIVRSDVDVVNDDHTKAIQERIESALKKYEAEEDEKLSAGEITSLSAGVAELVWQSILSQIETVTESVEESEYFYLAESLQQQIQELEERKMKVSIKANIKNNMDMTSDELLSMVNGMTDQELEKLAKSLGLSMEELQKLLESYQADTNKEIDSKLKEKLTEMQKDLEKELSKGLEGTGNANNGNATKVVAGEQGKDGRDGKDGKDGKDGATGKSVFFRYSESSSGTNMTEVPTSKTKYMGTYTGTQASTNPADYIWTRYSDATISFSDGTLYITQ